IKASIIGNSRIIIVENGKLALGTWEGIFLCEFDGPRTRKVFIRIL
ncbi:MAG: YjbQ family protein, partial [Deltaproteobacteria bacterium]|nr:YjbQ family protein [Deltaproteobacteria bacterium]